MRRVIIIHKLHNAFHQRLNAWKWYFLRTKLWWRVNKLKKTDDIGLEERIIIIGEFIPVSRTHAHKMLLKSLKEVLEREHEQSSKTLEVSESLLVEQIK